MKTLKRILICLLAAAMLLPMTACSGGSGDVVELDFLRLGNDEAEKQFWLDVIAEYEAEHKNVKINYDDAAIGDAMETKLTSTFHESGACVGKLTPKGNSTKTPPNSAMYRANQRSCSPSHQHKTSGRSM